MYGADLSVCGDERTVHLTGREQDCRGDMRKLGPFSHNPCEFIAKRGNIIVPWYQRHTMQS